MAQLMNKNYRSSKEDCDRAIVQASEQANEQAESSRWLGVYMRVQQQQIEQERTIKSPTLPVLTPHETHTHRLIKTTQVPTNVKAYYRKARACQALHQHEEAIQACDMGLAAAEMAMAGGGDIEKEAAAQKELRAIRENVRTFHVRACVGGKCQ